MEITSVITVTRASDPTNANRLSRDVKITTTSKENVRKIINPGGGVADGTIEIGVRKYSCDIFRDFRTGQCRDCHRYGHHGAQCVYDRRCRKCGQKGHHEKYPEGATNKPSEWQSNICPPM